MSGSFEPDTRRTPTIERALALLLMVDERDVTDGPIIAELAAQLDCQMAHKGVQAGPEHALVTLALNRAKQECPTLAAGLLHAA